MLRRKKKEEILTSIKIGYGPLQIFTLRVQKNLRRIYYTLEPKEKCCVAWITNTGWQWMHVNVEIVLVYYVPAMHKNRGYPQPEERSVNLFSLLVERSDLCHSYAMLPTYKGSKSWRSLFSKYCIKRRYHFSQNG